MLQILALNGFLVGACVLIHYEFLYRAAAHIPEMTITGRWRILMGIFVALTAHIIEIWAFALGYWFAIHYTEMGELIGNFSGSLLDCVYFSMTVYSTLGFGDIEPLGYLRFMVGIESLTGLVMITWTASFLFLEMQRHWKEK